jgi:hypothetical protein
MVSSMSLFEKIEFETIETQETEDIPQSLRKWTDETFVIQYPWSKKIITLILSLCVLPMFQVFNEDGVFAFEVFLILGFVIGVWYLSDLILTTDITFFQDRIVKNGYLSQTEIPTDELVMDVNEQNIRFFHATEKNTRESVTIRRFMIATEDCADIIKYAADAYHVTGKRKTGVSATGKKAASSLALAEFHKAVSLYRMTTVFFVMWSLIAIFTAGLADKFYGLTPELPAFPARVICIALTIAAFFLQKRLDSAGTGQFKGEPLGVRLKRAEHSSFLSAAATNVVALLGLLLYLMFGNLFDFYLFLLVGVLYFVDFYPRFSLWEKVVRGSVPAPYTGGSEPRRRSLQVSLVLMGALAVTSYGESQNYLYTSRKDCVDDWGDGQDCREVPAGSGGHYGSSRYYGPRYGSGGGRMTRSVGVGTISRGGFGSLGSFHGSFGG